MFLLSERKLTQKDHADRRQKLANLLGDGNVAIIRAASVQLRNRDTEFGFRQSSDYFYLTGSNEPDGIAVIAPGSAFGDYILFVQKKDPVMETWTGHRMGVEGAKTSYGADTAYTLDELDDIMPKLLDGCETLFYGFGEDDWLDTQTRLWIQTIDKNVRKGAKPPKQIAKLNRLLHEMRLIKSTREIELMQKSADIAAEAHKKAMLVATPGTYEYEVEAYINFEFKKHGCDVAYSSIVAGGENACILHYVDNNAVLKANDLLLIDAGAEYEYYASDITRTFPVSGKFTAEQKAVYEVVLNAQLAAIDAVVVGNDYNAPHQASIKAITEGLVDLGLLSGTVDSLIETEQYKKFFMHNTGHWLGLDVHDVGAYKIDQKWRPLQAGMVLTIEPGIYITPSDDVDSKWHNIGIRIEDDVHVTASGPQILTSAVPKAVSDIEALLATRS